MNIAVYVFLFLLPWQTRLILRTNEVGYLEISLYAVDLLLVLFLVSNILPTLKSINFKSSPTILFQKREFALILFFVFWNVVSIFWASDKILAIQHVFWLLLVVGLGWLVYKAKDINKIFFCFCVGLIFPAWLAIWQFVTQITFANKWLGLAAHKAALGGTSVVETFVDGYAFRWLRAYGSFDHPNILGMVMVVGIILLTAEMVRKGCGNNAEENSNPTRTVRLGADGPLLTVAYYVAIVSFVAALFFSLSRSAWLGLVIGLGGFGLYGLRNKLRNCAWTYGKTVVVILAVFLVLGFTYKDVVMVRSDSGSRLEKKSLDDRALYWSQAKEIIKQNPIIGVGAGNYVAYLKAKNPDNQYWTYQPVHNVFMLIWAELGILGLLAFLGIYGTMILRAYKRNPLGFCLLLVLLPVMLLDHWLWSLHFGLLLIGLIVGIALNKRLPPRLARRFARRREAG